MLEQHNNNPNLVKQQAKKSPNNSSKVSLTSDQIHEKNNPNNR